MSRPWTPETPMTDVAARILGAVFGFDSFRPLQAEVIANVLGRKDTLVVMPTGGGKSLCYQIPALAFAGLTVVVSPLISLMKDQVDQLTGLGVDAVCLNSALPQEQHARNVALVRDGRAKLLYVAPESLFKPGILAMLDAVRVDCVAVDEAHCISEWGHDFRPEYRQLASLRNRFSSAVWIALTATATPRVRRDIRDTLGFADSSEFVGSFNRENLFLEIRSKADAFGQTLRFLETRQDRSGIIYCFTRKQVDDLHAALAAAGHSVAAYHAGMTEADRHRSQEAFIRDDARIMIATVAFGMGIDKPDVRFVIHYDLPKNIESYYQEIGRAGRDGLRADCLLLFSYGDIVKIRYFIDQKEGNERRAALAHLDALLDLVEGDECRRIPLLAYFGETATAGSCEMCDNCLDDGGDRTDVTVAAQKFLSCVKRTGERFGAHHVVHVLLGSREKRVLALGHDRLSTYGIGREFSKAQWLDLSRLLLRKRLMQKDREFGSLRLMPDAWKVFRGEMPVFAKLRPATPATVKAPAEIANHDPRLFEILRRKRKALADDQGVPPYAVFPDRTLMEMAAYFPRSVQSLQSIHGVGRVKLERYGDLFLQWIDDYCQEHGIAEKPKPARTVPPSTPSGGGLRYMVVGEACKAGKSIPEIMEELGVKEETVLDHLLRYVREGHALSPEQCWRRSELPEPDRKRVLDAFERLGTDYLKPVFEEMQEKISYLELKRLRLAALCRAANANPALTEQADDHA